MKLTYTQNDDYREWTCNERPEFRINEYYDPRNRARYLVYHYDILVKDCHTMRGAQTVARNIAKEPRN